MIGIIKIIKITNKVLKALKALARKGSILSVASVLCFSFVIVSNSEAAQELLLSSDSNLKAIISNKGVNHLSIQSDRIDEVIGNDEEYQIEGDNDNGHVFITPKVKAGSLIHVTLTSEKGVVQNIDLKVDDQLSPQTIILKGGRSLNISSNEEKNNSRKLAKNADFVSYQGSISSGSRSYKDEIISAIKLIQNNQTLPHYTKQELSSFGCSNKEESVHAETASSTNVTSYIKGASGKKYSSSDLNIYEIKLKNKLFAKEKDFKHCLANIIAVSLQDNKLFMVQENVRR